MLTSGIKICWRVCSADFRRYYLLPLTFYLLPTTLLTLDPTFKASLSKIPSTICWCWLITRRDGGMIGFTSLDVPIAIGGVTYYGTTGFNPGAAQQSQGVDKVDSQTLKGILDRSGISKADLSSGIYDGAQVRRFLVDYTNLPSSLDLDPAKHRELPIALIGSKKQNNLGYELQIKDLISKLDNKIGTVTTKTCRANLGDGNCGVDLAPFTHNLSVTGGNDRRVFSIDGNFANQYFDQGRLQFTSGANQGLHLDIAYYTNNQIILAVPAPFAIAPGDNITELSD